MSDQPAKNIVNTNGSATGGSELTPELPLLEKPEQPTPYACCESGCTPCVWDVYYEKLRKWQAQQAALKS